MGGGGLEAAGEDMVDMLDAIYEKRLDAWDAQCTYYMARHDMYSIRPVKTLTKNNGFGSDCEHCTRYSVDYDKQAYYNFLPDLPDKLPVDRKVVAAFTAACNRVCFAKRVARVALRVWKRMFGSPNRDPIDIKE